MSVETAIQYERDQAAKRQQIPTSITRARADRPTNASEYAGHVEGQSTQSLYLTQGVSAVGQTFLDQVRHHHHHHTPNHSRTYWQKGNGSSALHSGPGSLPLQIAPDHSLEHGRSNYENRRSSLPDSTRGRRASLIELHLKNSKMANTDHDKTSESSLPIEPAQSASAVRMPTLANLRSSHSKIVQKSLQNTRNGLQSPTHSMRQNCMPGSRPPQEPKAQGRSPAEQVDEVVRLRTLCLNLSHENAIQNARIHSFEQMQKSATELGAQWNTFHHSQMHRQAAMFRAYMDAKDLEAKNVQSVLESSVARLVAANDELAARLQTTRTPISHAPAAAGSRLLLAHSRLPDTHCASLKRKVPDDAESVIVLQRSPSDSASTITERIALHTTNGVVTPVHGTQSPIKLVDGILPPPLSSLLEKLESPAKFIEPQIPEIRESPDPPLHKKLRLLPKIEIPP